MSKDNNKHSKFQERKNLLRELSQQAKVIRERMVKEAKNAKEAFFYASKPLNFYILNFIYDVEGAEEFKTFKQWKNEGYTIKKGSKAFVLWGQPRELSNPGKEEQAEDPESGEDETFFPVCYLFSDKQVYKRDKKDKPKEKTNKKRTEPIEIDEV